jgi:hypothetical protein
MLGVPRNPPIAAPPVTDTEEATVPSKGNITTQQQQPLTSSLNSEDNSMDDIVVEGDHRLVPKELEAIAVYSDTITSGGHEFVIEGIPITHRVVTKSYSKRLVNTERQLKDLQEGVQYSRFGGGSSLMISLTAVALTSCPALPLSQATNMIPLFVGATLVDAGVIDRAKVAEFAVLPIRDISLGPGV